MTESDLVYITHLLKLNVIKSPVLELGVGYGGKTCRELVQEAGLQYYGTDLSESPSVDFVADFEKPGDMKVFSQADSFGSVLILNVLEHTFDPITILNNATVLVKPGGNLIIITPTIWYLHNYPMDTYRLLPNFYEEYSRRNGLILEETCFEWVGIGKVRNYRDPEGRYVYPRATRSNLRDVYSRIVHKVFNTTGRGMWWPSLLAIGVVLTKPDSSHLL